MEGFKKHSPDDGSSPSDNHHNSPAHAKYDQLPAPEPSYPMRANSNALEDLGNLDTKHGDFEQIDIEHHSPDLFGEKKMSDSEGPKGSDSESGSDSDSGSDSSDNGSHRSKSRTPVGSRSGSSSDSDSDASSNSNAASDEDVDIMTSDDEKELKQKVQASEPGQLKSAFAWKTADGKADSIGTTDKQGDLVVNVIEIEKDLLDDENVGQIAGATNSNSNKGQVPEQETKPPSPEWNDHGERQVYAGWSHGEKGNMAKEDPSYEQSDNLERRVSKSKSKRGLSGKECDSKPDRAKRLKGANVDQLVVIGTRNLPSVESPRYPSPDRLDIQIAGAARDDAADFVLQKGYSQGTYPKSSFENQQLSQRFDNPGPRANSPAPVERPGKHVHSAGGAKHSERSIPNSEDFLLQREKFNQEQQDDDTFSKNKRSAKQSEEGLEDKQSTPVESHYRKHNMLRKLNKAGSVSNMQIENSSKNTNDVYRSSVGNGQSINLRREPSDLELGELREPLPKETHGKLYDRKSSSKHLENRLMSSEYWNSDSYNEKPAGRVSSVSGRIPPHNANIAVSGILESSKSRSPDHYSNNCTKYQHRTEQNQSKADLTDPGSQYNKLAEGTINNRESDAVVGLGTLQQDDSRREVVPLTLRGNTKPPSNTSTDLNDRRKDTSLTESNDGGRKRRESSSDEISCSYSKYEKEKPELKGPVKDFSQYEEYVQEYNAKYEIYLSLNKNLESYRNEFSQLGRDLEASKGKDRERYDDLLAQLKESYRQCGAKHKRLKKIFIVIHAELKHLKEMITDFAAYTKD